MRQRPLPILLLCTLLVLGLLWAGFHPLKSSAAYPHLPPRPTVVPTPVPTATAAPSGPRGARIRLTANPHLGTIWSVVQWQGGDGVWHDVEGWRGEVNRGVVGTPQRFRHRPLPLGDRSASRRSSARRQPLLLSALRSGWGSQRDHSIAIALHPAREDADIRSICVLSCWMELYDI